jgi:Amt family ammonium transporter
MKRIISLLILLGITCSLALAQTPAAAPAETAPAPQTETTAPAAEPPAAEAAAPAAPAEPTAPVPDPSGGSTGKASDISVKDAAKPTPEELLGAIGKNKVSINMMWVLITGFIVMFMQTGSRWLRPV